LVDRTQPLRQARPEDNGDLVGLLRRCPQGTRLIIAQDRSPDFFLRARAYRQSAIWVADAAQGGLAATATAALKGVRLGGTASLAAYVFDVAVDQAHRKQGLARELLAESERWARSAGASILYAHVLRGNAASAALFAAAGYEPIRTLRAFLMPLGRRASRAESAGDWRAAGEDDWEGVAALLAETYSKHELRPEPDGTLRDHWCRLPGLVPEDVRVRGLPARPDAVAAVWNYGPVAASLPVRLPAGIRIAGAACRALSLPSLPRLGEASRYAILLGAATRPGEPAERRSAIRAALRRAAALGLMSAITMVDPADPIVAALRGLLRFSDRYQLMVKELEPGATKPLERGVIYVDPVDL